MTLDMPPSFAPWRDDAFLPQESTYALWNKISWFSTLKPKATLSLYAKFKVDVTNTAKRARGGKAAKTANAARKFDNAELLPHVLGRNLVEVERDLQDVTWEETPNPWRAIPLRICGSCIADGIHLRIHQHLAVARCPLHDEPLRDTCDACGRQLTSPPGDRRAFCCQSCGHCLLADDMIRFDFDGEFREWVANAHAEVMQWLQYLECGIYRGHLSQGRHEAWGHDLTHIDGRSLAMEAVGQSCSQLPSWMTRPTRQLKHVSVVSIRSGASPLTNAFEKNAVMDARFARRLNLLSAPPVRWGEKSLSKEHRTLAVHYQQALRRVASVFLRSTGGSHPRCMDTPRLIDRESFDGRHHLFDFEMLSCCPIGLGFWFWRERSGAFFSNLLCDLEEPLVGVTPESLGSSMDLIFYALERSHLHACVVAAAELVSTWGASQGNPRIAKACMDMMWHWETGARYVRQDQLERLYFDPTGLGMTFVRVDAIQLTRHTRCPGHEPFYRSVRQKLGRSYVPNSRTFEIETKDLEDHWQERANELIGSLRPMKYDWVFFSQQKGFQAKHRDRAVRSAEAMADELKIKPYECVDRAINHRAAALTPPGHQLGTGARTRPGR